MTIAKRLALLILISILCLLSVGVFSLLQIRQINQEVKEVNENVLPSLSLIERAEVAFLRARPPLLSALTATSPAKRAEFEKRYAERMEELNHALNEYEPYAVDEQDRTYLRQSRQFAVEYRRGAEKIIAFANQGQLESAHQVIAELRPVIDGLTQNLLAHAKHNHDLADARGKAVEVLGVQSLRVALTIMVLGVVLMAGMGFAIYRHVHSSLGGMVEMFGRVERELDFTSRLKVVGRGEVAQTALAFNRLLDRLQASLRDIGERSASVSGVAHRVATAAEQMSTAAGHQSESASHMAATIEEMTVSINHVADRAGEANQLSVTSGQLAGQGEVIIGETTKGIHGIASTVDAASGQIDLLQQQSEQISHVVAVIKEVADQTNLLALNAAIEAARAGEQGRGFAVVADEVRKLAERTTLSTQKIASTIEQMQSCARSAVEGIQVVVKSVDSGVGSAASATGVIQEIGAGSRQAVGMVADITDAIREQSVASTAIAQQVEKIAQMSEENSALSHSTAMTAGELAELSQAMQVIVAQYRV